MPDLPNTVVHLRADQVSLVLDLTEGRLPAILHWGADLEDLTAESAAALITSGLRPLAGNTVDPPMRLALLPEHRTGWVGRPGLSGSRAGRDWSPEFVVTQVDARRPDDRVDRGRHGDQRRRRDPGRRGGRRGGPAPARPDRRALPRRPAPYAGRADQHRRRRVRAERLRDRLPGPADGPGDPGLRRALGQGTGAAAADAQHRHAPARGPARPHRPGRDHPAARRHARVRLRRPARSGRCTSAGAATTPTTRSGCPPASR